MIKSLLIDGTFRPTDIKSIVGTSLPYVSRISARMRAPVSRIAMIDTRLRTLQHEVAKLRDRVEEVARLHGQPTEK